MTEYLVKIKGTFETAIVVKAHDKTNAEEIACHCLHSHTQEHVDNIIFNEDTYKVMNLEKAE